MSFTKNTALCDPDFTNSVIAATGPNASARLKEIMPALIRHVHAFAREVNLTTEEYMAGIAMINWAGQMSNDRRNEGQLLTDVIGLETLVDEIDYKSAAAAASSATPSAILADGQIAYMYGQVKDVATGKPTVGATLDVWQASTNGLYEQQDAEQEPHNLRGVFTTDSDGNYAFYCLRPTPYPASDSTEKDQELAHANTNRCTRHHYRPGHIHLILKCEGYKSITTQIFHKETPYLNNDSVFAVKAGLCIDFLPRKGDAGAEWETKYDIAMAAL
ncbi:hypothetical protein CBER1_04204 [Cercospora berteroae]|uniref:Intradiol ring-cleavage dioxygenases domain-containing protein n=1 Tax=Cercospora berteroae TaxID=357750 RepID=A0A2S6CHR2_9PEZI|nr:hypothetical protein CBER1_04204 [Cercospora berteroae]